MSGLVCPAVFVLEDDSLHCDLTEGHTGPHIDFGYGGTIAWEKRDA